MKPPAPHTSAVFFRPPSASLIEAPGLSSSLAAKLYAAREGCQWTLRYPATLTQRPLRADS